jgi:hypothetical protein
MITRIWVILLIVLSLGSCVEEFQPQLEDTDPLLVVDGKLSNLEGPYTISLARSTGLDIQDLEAVTGAEVSILEKNGPTVILEEIEPGTYRTAENVLQGEVGKSYKLQINVGGKHYESDYELLKKPTAIASVEPRFEYQSTFESPEDVPGIQFYIDTEESTFKEDYYLWNLEGTYQYHSSLLIYYVYDGSLREFDNHDTLHTCYQTYDIGGVFTAGTENLNVAQVVDKPLYFLPAVDRRLSVRYSLLTTQYSLSKDAYEFWKQVEIQSAGGESLYTTQPYQIRGNVKNVNDSDEAVLGYFTVAGVSQNRIFVDKPEEVNIEFEKCIPDGLALMLIFDLPAEYWPIYLPGAEDGLGWVEPECMDCQLLGGVLEKPSFWID